MEIENLLARLMRQTLNDIKVECDDEFQQNFRREAFFSDKWQRRKYDDGSNRKVLQGLGESGVHLSQIADSGRIEGSRITYSSTLPYAAIHNEGGVITVTDRMKRYFWFKYLQIEGSKTEKKGRSRLKSGYGYKKDGTMRNDKKNRKLSAESEFYKAMALKKIGSKIIIPQRKFIGDHPQLQKSVVEIIEKNLAEFFEKENPARNVINP